VQHRVGGVLSFLPGCNFLDDQEGSRLRAARARGGANNEEDEEEEEEGEAVRDRRERLHVRREDSARPSLRVESESEHEGSASN
jgi:hypothetical protein